MSVYEPKPGAPKTQAAALVFPGGGYVRLAWEGEGVDTCDWLNGIGVTCLLVKYRVPHKTHYPEDYAAFEDAQQAMRVARSHAAEWGFDPHKVGAIGYSAGAHLAVVLSTHHDDKHVMSTPGAQDVKADVSARPDFQIVMYPGYLTAPPALRDLDPSAQPTKDVPPSFVLQAEDDPVHVENALVYYRALKDAGVPAELHVFPTGRHGFGVHPAGSPEEHWTDLATTWLRSLKMLQ
jgi:acetyl esterase/lipase